MKMMRLSEINKMACDRQGQGTPHNSGINRGQTKVHKVMKEFKMGELHSGSGKIVKKRSQAVAIAMSEAGLSKK